MKFFVFYLITLLFLFTAKKCNLLCLLCPYVALESDYVQGRL